MRQACAVTVQDGEQGQESMAVPQVPVLGLPGMPGADQVPCPIHCLLPLHPHIHMSSPVWRRVCAM